jgi:hypothetical protein
MDDKTGEAGGLPAPSLLELAAELKNVSAACRRLGLDRSVYYRIKKMAESGGFAAHRTGRARKAGSEELERSVLRLCLEYPDWGCDRLGYYLTLTGHPVSSPTVQKILIRNGLGRKEQRAKEARRRG